MRKTFTAMAAISALLAGAAVMQLKHSVQEQAERVAELADQIHDDKESLRILEAEWAYLTSPRALQDQSIEFLALMPPSSRQIIGSIEDIPMRRSDENVDGDANILLPTAQQREQKSETTPSPGTKQQEKTL